MGGLTSYAWRSLAARPLRSLLTIVGIALGVAVLFAALATNAAIDGAIDRTVHDLLGRADLRVEGFTERGLSAASTEAIGDTAGIDGATPILERRTYLAPSVASPTERRASRRRSPSSASTRSTYALVHDLDLAAGVGLDGVTGPGALITERLARDTGQQVGGTIALLGPDGPRSEPIVGILTGDGPLASTDGRTVVVALPEAQTVFATTAASRVDVELADGATPDAVAVALDERLRDEPYVLTGPTELAASIRASTIDFQATTALIAALALFGGAFLIFNTLSMTVAERAREVGLLRAAGATRRQVNGLFLVQALIIGVAGGLLGIVLGAGLAALVAGYLAAAAVVPIDGPVLEPSGALLALVIGAVVTLAAALEPADRAGRIPPVEALRPTGTGRTVRARLRWLVVVFAVVAVAGLALWPSATGSAGTIVAGSSSTDCLLVATLVTPFLLAPARCDRRAALPADHARVRPG